MRGISCASAALLAVAVSLPLDARGLTETDFLEDVLSDHPGVVAAEARLAAEAGARRQAGVLANPELAWEREDPDVAARQDTWRLSWRLPLDGRRHRLDEADAAVAAATAMVDATRLDLRLELRELFAAWYLASERERVLRGQLGETRRLAEWLRARALEGEAAGVEARRLELEAEVLARRLAEASAAARGRRAAAAAWSDLVSAGAIPERPGLAPPPVAVDLSTRPDLLALEQRVAEAEARQRLAARVLAPPEVSVGWLRLEDGAQSLDGPVLGVTWPVPLLDRQQGRRHAAAAEVEHARARLEAARRRAMERAEAALATYTTLHRALATTHAGADPDVVVDGVLAAFAAGEASLTDVLDAVRTTVDVRLARLDTLAAALAAGRDLEAALGRPLLPGGSS